jgi:hypothetical protein
MKPKSMTGAARFQQLCQLPPGKLLYVYNGVMGLPNGTFRGRELVKEGMIRSILGKEGFVQEDYREHD